MDSYVTLQYADEYHSKRTSAERWAILDDTQKEKRLVSASDFIDENFDFVDDLNEKIRNGEVEAPIKLMNAICEVAASNELIISRSRTQNSVKIDVIQIEYKDDDSAYQNALNRIKNMLGDLVEANTPSLFVRISR